MYAVIRKILEGLAGCVNILDDILVHGNGTVQHDQRLRRVLDRLSHYNATVRVDKCAIGQSEVDFNGHRISAAGVQPLASNVEAILNMPVPVDPRCLSRFISTATYYLKFMPRFADLCEPLRALLKKDAVWSWSDECQCSFDAIKRMLASPPTLAHFDATAPTIVTSDSSGYALGACLSQIQNGRERPVAFASRTLSSAERKYSASEREALGALWACEKWHFYLYGRHFTLVTDHQALRTLLKSSGSGHRPLRLHRWSSRLLKYSFSVMFKPGADLVVADCLSRAFVPADMTVSPTVTSSLFTPQEAESVGEDDPVAEIQTIFGAVGTSIVTFREVGRVTEADSVLQQVAKYIVDGWPTSRQRLSAEFVPYFDVRHELSLVSGCVVRGFRTVIPPSLRQQVLSLLHEGHPGIVRMKTLARDAVWWPGMDLEIERLVRECEPCVVSGKSVRPYPGPLKPFLFLLVHGKE